MNAYTLRATTLVLAMFASSGVVLAQAEDAEAPPAQPSAIAHDAFVLVDAPAAGVPLRNSRGSIGVRPDLAALARVRVGDTLNVASAPGVVVPVVVDVVNVRSDTQRSIQGHVPGAPMATLLMVVEHDAVAMDLRIPTANQHFRLKYVADGVHLVCDIDDRLYGECGGATPAPPDAPWRGVDFVPEEGAISPDELPEGGFTPRGACSNIETTFDVMVVYTELARIAAGGTNAIRAEVQLGVDTSNQTYDNSGVVAHYRLVWQGEVDYNESGALTDHRDRLADPDDGFYDWAPVTRDTYNADLCSIWVDDSDGGQWCGFAFCEVDSDSAYCSVNWECAAGNFSYPHEHGHNQGCAHNPEDAGSGCNEYSYSYGHRFTSGGNFYRSVMAYNTDNGPYVRVGYWSNPDVNYLGVPTGTATRDNARSLNNTRGTVEGFELTRMDIWVDADPVFPALQNGSFSFPYDQVGESVAAIQVPHSSITAIPVLHVVTGDYSYTGSITKEMTIVPCSGPATIGN